jgi:cyclohexadienyl dehydratase
MVVVQPPATRERELEAGRIDVFMTDYPYSRRLLDNADWAHLITPPSAFNIVPYGYAVKPGDDAWLAQVDAFVARIKRDGPGFKSGWIAWVRYPRRARNVWPDFCPAAASAP